MSAFIESEAMKLITSYLRREFGLRGESYHFDIRNIGLAYTDIEEIPSLSISASVDLENFEICRYLNGIPFDKKIFNSPADFLILLPQFLDFDYLTEISYLSEKAITLLLDSNNIDEAEAEVLRNQFQ